MAITSFRDIFLVPRGWCRWKWPNVRKFLFTIYLQAALKKSNLELEAELKVKLNNIEMLNEAAQMKDKIIKVIL